MLNVCIKNESTDSCFSLTHTHLNRVASYNTDMNDYIPFFRNLQLNCETDGEGLIEMMQVLKNQML